jgi:hypothetical protein
MGYRIRILGKSLAPAPLKQLQEQAKPAVLEIDPGVGDDWEALILKHSSGLPIAFIEKNPVIEGQLGFDELREFAGEVSYYKPDSAASWLKSYFTGVRVIYSFQLLSGTEVDDGFSLMHRVYAEIWSCAGGILQADLEGFTNEQGHTILWQFDESVTGEWNVGVLAPNGQWSNFEMDLGNMDHRNAFWRGEVPYGVKLIGSTVQ